MSESQLTSVTNLQPGDVINFADLTELVAFEDLIVSEISPYHDHEVWITRPHLRNFIKPPKFYGTIADIALRVMDHAYEKLLDPASRGYRKGGGEGFRLSDENAVTHAPRYKGFEFFANAKSTGPGKVGQIQTELYYYPFTPKITRAGSYITKKRVDKHTGEEVLHRRQLDRDAVSNMSSLHGDAIGRVILQPKLETENFIKLNEDSCRVRVAVLRDGIAHSYRG